MYIPMSDPVLHRAMQKPVSQLKAGVCCFAPNLVPHSVVSTSEEIRCSDFGKQPLIAEAKGDSGSCAVLVWSRRHQWPTCCHSAPRSVLCPRYSLNQTNERTFQITDWRSRWLRASYTVRLANLAFITWSCFAVTLLVWVKARLSVHGSWWLLWQMPLWDIYTWVIGIPVSYESLVSNQLILLKPLKINKRVHVISVDCTGAKILVAKFLS